MSTPTVAVTGFGRCGSSMTMAMLDAGGLQPVEGSADRSYEVVNVEQVWDMTSAQLEGRAVKLLDYAQWFAMDRLPAVDWRFIWLDRDRREQARSQVKLMRSMGMPVPLSGWRDLAASYGRDRDPSIAKLASLGPVLELRYEDVLADPMVAAIAIERFVGPAFDPIPAQMVVHTRSGRCARGLTFEATGRPA